MLTSLFKNLRREATLPDGPLRLHIGGQQAHSDWKIFDLLPGPHVDFVGNCTDLSQFAEGSVTEIYASHVLEHLGYRQELPLALAEFHRVLEPGGSLRVSVPDLATLCALFGDPALTAEERVHVMRMMFGGQIDAGDFHKVGLTEAFLADFLAAAGFVGITRSDSSGPFEDSSKIVFRDRRISLNLSARKP